MPPTAVGPPFDQFLATAEAVAQARPEVDLEMAREVFLEAATLLYNDLALDGLDGHDANAVVAGVCRPCCRGSRRRRTRTFPGDVAGSWRSARPRRCVCGVPHRCSHPPALSTGPPTALAAMLLLAVLRRWQTEVFAKHGDIVTIDVTPRVADVILQGELRRFASKWHSADVTVPGQVMGGEQERCVDAAIVQSAVAERLVQVKIDATTVTVPQGEVPGRIAGPRMNPIDPLIGETSEETFGVNVIHPDIELPVLPRHFAD